MVEKMVTGRFWMAKKKEFVFSYEFTLYAVIENNLSWALSQISKSLNISQKRLERWIRKLKYENKIEFRGSKKTGGYYAK